jgi:hypothetical protein
MERWLAWMIGPFRKGHPMPFPDRERLPEVFEDQAEIEAEFEELDQENLRAADFVANLARIIRDIRRRN